MVIENQPYWEIIIRSSLSGNEIAEVLIFIHTLQPHVRYVEVDELSGGRILQFGDTLPRIIEFDHLISLCVPIAQLDWGDFFFLQEPVSVADTTSYPEAIGKTSVTVRCVDSYMLYVYTNVLMVKEALLSKYDVMEVSERDLQDFEYLF